MSVGTILLIYIIIGLICSLIYSVIERLETDGKGYNDDIPNEEEEKLNFCKKYCNDNKIRIDYINESPVLNTRKPYYNILLDDRAGLEEAYFTLKEVVDYIKNN